MDIKKFSFPPKFQVMGLAVMLFAVILSAFWDLTDFGFVNFDDDTYILNNPIVARGLSWEGVRYAFTSIQEALWHPLTWLFRMGMMEFFGPSARAFHSASLLLHILNTLLVFFLFLTTTREILKSACVAFLFAIHPLRVESVAWITVTNDLLSAFWALLALVAYTRYATSKSRGSYWLSLSAYALALLSKPIVMTFPLLLLLWDLWPLNRKLSVEGWRTLLIEKIPFLSLSVMVVSLTLASRLALGVFDAADQITLFVRLGRSVVNYSVYLSRFFCPVNLSVSYLSVGSRPLHQILGATILLILVTGWVWRWFKRCPPVAVGWTWFLLVLFPVIGLFQGDLLLQTADRYSYFSFLGLFVMAAWGLPKLFDAGVIRNSVFAAVVCAGLMVFWVQTRQQLSFWRDSFTLWEHALQVNPSNYLAHGQLGVAYYKAGRVEQSMVHLKEALKINPRYFMARRNLGIAYVTSEKYKAAIAELKIALGLKPADLDVLYNLSKSYYHLGRYPEAQKYAATALRHQPLFPLAHVMMGSIHLRNCRLRKALDHTEKALALQPNLPAAVNLRTQIQALEGGTIPEKKAACLQAQQSQIPEDVES